MANKKYTWEKLKTFINGLPETELKKEVVWWGEERGGTITSAMQLKEDYVQSDEGCEPASVIDYGEGEDALPIAYKKGTPILSVD